MPVISRYWAILRLRAIAPLTIVEYRDQDTPEPRVLSGPASLFPHFFENAWVEDAVKKISAQANARTGPAPIFLDTIEELEPLDLELFFQAVTKDVLTARLSRAPWIARSATTLPLRVIAAGPNAASWFDDLKAQPWLQSEAAQTHGLQLHATDRDAIPLLHAVRPDVIFATEPNALLRVASEMAEADRPRLVVWLDDTFVSPAPMAAPPDVGGVPLMRIAPPPGGALKLVTEIFYQFTHDRPLHQMAQDVASAGALRTRLTADPFSVHSLRLHRALRQIRREAQTWETRFQQLPAKSALRHWIGRTREVRDFLGEGHAFVPMTDLSASMERSTAAPPRDDVADLELDDLTNLELETEQRAAHVAIERLDTQPFLESVTAKTSLAANASYQLRIHIGSPLPDSLVQNPEPIDPLLGPPDDSTGYDLEVAVQGKEFVVESERVVKLRLPMKGNSDPIYFEVRTPQSFGSKELRLCIYHRNYLVQSLLLEALIETYETTHPSPVTKVIVETTQAPDWDVCELGERALSIGMNQGGGGATHDFVLKSDGGSRELSLPATTFQATHDEIRKQIEAASRDPKNPKYPRDYPKIPPGSPTPDNVASSIRAFAVWGHKLYDAFFDRAAEPGSALRPQIVALQSASGQRIQVFRFKYEDAFFWPLLYDWDIPADPTAPVCLGWMHDATGQVVPCGHDASSGQYCVRGFWGVRHRIEELLPGVQAKKVGLPKADKPVRLVADSGLPESIPLSTDLTNDLGATAVAAGPVQVNSLLDVLFKTTDARPSLLILLGHHERKLQPGGLGQSRIKIDPAPVWLSEDDIRGRAQKQPQAWDQPRSAVVMMACASGTTGADTLTDFTTAWNACGASAIIGTQAVIGSPLAAHFARSFVKKAWTEKKDLGEAMAEIRGELLAEGNPLAFLFHAIGDIDLVLQ
jgi:hypothetical protein